MVFAVSLSSNILGSAGSGHFAWVIGYFKCCINLRHSICRIYSVRFLVSSPTTLQEQFCCVQVNVSQVTFMFIPHRKVAEHSYEINELLWNEGALPNRWNLDYEQKTASRSLKETAILHWIELHTEQNLNSWQLRKVFIIRWHWKDHQLVGCGHLNFGHSADVHSTNLKTA